MLSQGFEIETEMTIHAVDKNMSTENLIIEYRDRPDGSVSKLNTYSDGFKVLKTIAKLYKNYKPLRFFSTVSAVLLILAAIFFAPVFADYLKTGLVPRIPTLIVCGFAVVAAMQSYFTGLILSTIARKSKYDFEINLIRAEDDFKRKLAKENTPNEL